MTAAILECSNLYIPWTDSPSNERSFVRVVFGSNVYILYYMNIHCLGFSKISLMQILSYLL